MSPSSTAAPARAIHDRADQAPEHRDVVSLVASGWVAVALAALFRDVHELFRPGLIDQMRAGVVNGTEITDGLLVAGGVGVVFVVAMPLVVRVAPWRAARLLVLAAVPATMAMTVANGIRDADDVLFAVFQFATLVWVATVAWRHRPAIA